jgi:O-antigen ligase
VAVEGEAVSAPLKSQGRLPGASVRMPRLTLWKAALAMWAGRPIIGVGPDNYRHLYGRYLQLANWDQRVHANNTYFEALADTGVLGLAALAWVVVAGARAIRDRWRHATLAAVPLVAALIAAWLSIAGHGLVDSFVTFTPTYVLFALTAGLTFSPSLKPQAPSLLETGHANRI